MRLIFMDEAGTSAKEPVSVVVGLIADADEHVLQAERLAEEIIAGVPEKIRRNNFAFHATQVFGDKKYRDEWSQSDRLTVLKSMMSIPRKVGIPITVGACWRNSISWDDLLGRRPKLPAHQQDHAHAFYLCACISDRNIRQHARHNEVGYIVAEDIPDMKIQLNAMLDISARIPVTIPPADLRKTVKDAEAGYLTQSGDMRTSRIRNSIHFVGKKDDILVQVADACAYGIRRRLSKQKFGEDFEEAIFGSSGALREFAPPCGGGCFWPKVSSFK